MTGVTSAPVLYSEFVRSLDDDSPFAVDSLVGRRTGQLPSAQRAVPQRTVKPNTSPHSTYEEHERRIPPLPLNS